MTTTIAHHCLLLTVLLLCLLSSTTVQSANILAIFPTASYSHQIPLLTVPRALAQRGHNVTVITTNPLRKPMKNYTEIDISFTYDYWKPKKTADKKLIDLQGKLSTIEMLNVFAKGVYKVTDFQLGSQPIQNFIKYIEEEKPKFDVILYEDLTHQAYLGFLHKLGYPPLISMYSLALLCGHDCSGQLLCNPSHMGEMMLGSTNKMNFYERVQNYLFYFYLKLVFVRELYKSNNELAGKYFGPDCPPVEELAQKRSLLLTSSSWIFEYPRPVFPNTILVGPLHIQDTITPLPHDLENWIRGAEKGFIYFSFGSNVRSAALEESKRSAILAAFDEFPEYRIIWKWEEEELEGLPSNVICRKWLPQQDLLAHPKAKLFISQGGLQSLQEAVHYQVPVIGIPFFGDQNFNVRIIPRLGIGTFMEYEDISTEALVRDIKHILNNESYSENLKRASSIVKNQMMSPLDTAVWWVEYVLKAGGNVNHLRPEYDELNLFQYLGLDVFLVLLTPLLLFVYGLYRLSSAIMSCCRRSRKIKKN